MKPKRDKIKSARTLYEGFRGPGGEVKSLHNTECRIYVSQDGKRHRPLTATRSLHEWRHSEEFNWGDGGSGPAQTALALLLDFTGDGKYAAEWHQSFKSAFVAQFEDSWQLTGVQILAWMAAAAMGGREAAQLAQPGAGRVPPAPLEIEAMARSGR